MTESYSRYIYCPKYKGKPKKHIDICRNCKWRKGCKPYFKYRQPELPFTFPKGI